MNWNLKRNTSRNEEKLSAEAEATDNLESRTEN